jgi:hypothetical protein
VALSRESRQELTRWLIPRLLLPLVMAATILAALLVQHLNESQRNEASELQHRIKQEECVIRVLNEVVEKRINARTEEPIGLCDPEPAIEDLRRRLDELR